MIPELDACCILPIENVNAGLWVDGLSFLIQYAPVPQLINLGKLPSEWPHTQILVCRT